MYRSRPFLERFLAECLKVLSDMECLHFEILLVNDGSPDDSLAYALERRLDIPQLVVVDLSRNFGHHHATQAGLRHARGNLIFLIDCDLEVSPLVLAGFHRKLRDSGCDMVFGYQEVRKGGRLERASGGLFWKGFNFLSDVKIPVNIVTERIMTRRFVDALLQMGDRNLFLAGMMSWTGFHQIGLPVVKTQREGKQYLHAREENRSYGQRRKFFLCPTSDLAVQYRRNHHPAEFFLRLLSGVTEDIF